MNEILNIEESLVVKTSMYGGQILGKRYDLINIDFNAQHPYDALIEMSKERPEELIFRTDVQMAAFVVYCINSHLEECRSGCPDYKDRRKIDEEAKFY